MNHENLSEILLAVGIDTVGPRGVLFAKCLLGLATLGFAFQGAFRQRLGLLPISLASLLVAVSLGPHWTMRPQILTYFLYALVLACLDEAFRDWPSFRWREWWQSRRRAGERAEHNQALRADPATTDQSPGMPEIKLAVHLGWLWCIPPLVIVATNTHGGFLAIGCVFVAYLSLRAAEGLALVGRSAWPLIGRFAVIALATACATSFNPYGLEYHVWLYHDLSIPRPEILEWHQPDWTSLYTLPLGLLLSATVFCLATSRRRWDATQLVLLGLTFWQTTEHLRHLPFFAIAWGFWMIPHLDAVWSRFLPATGGTNNAGMSPGTRFGFVVVMAGVALLIGAKLTTRFRELSVPRDEYPVSAFEYIAAQGFTGRMVCTFNWAQYALAALGPRSPEAPGILIHSDGRLRTSYPQEIIDMHFDFILGNSPEMRRRSPYSPPYDPGRILRYRDPDLVLLDRGQEPAQETMRAHATDWVLLYQDALAQLWGRATRYGDPQSPDYVPPSNRRVTDTPQQGTVCWPAIPRLFRKA